MDSVRITNEINGSTKVFLISGEEIEYIRDIEIKIPTDDCVTAIITSDEDGESTHYYVSSIDVKNREGVIIGNT